MVKAVGKVLDVACGTGENFPFFRSITDVTAIDLSPQMLDMARARAEKLGLTADYRLMDAEELAFPDKTSTRLCPRYQPALSQILWLHCERWAEFVEPMGVYCCLSMVAAAGTGWGIIRIGMRISIFKRLDVVGISSPSNLFRKLDYASCLHVACSSAYSTRLRPCLRKFSALGKSITAQTQVIVT
jgi:hypothetical protein